MKPNTPFAFLKIPSSTGGCIKQYYLPYFRDRNSSDLSLSALPLMIRVKNNIYFCSNLNRIWGFPQLLTALDRFNCYGLIDPMSEIKLGSHPVTCPLASEQFFECCFQTLLERLGKSRGGSVPARSLGTRRWRFLRKSLTRCREVTVLPSKKQQFDMEMLKRMMGRVMDFVLVDEGRSNPSPLCHRRRATMDLVWNLRSEKKQL